MDKDIIPNESCLEKLRVQRDVLKNDLKSLDNQLASATGLETRFRFEGQKQNETNKIDLEDKFYIASQDKGTKRNRLDLSDATSSFEEDELLNSRRNHKLPSVLVQSNFRKRVEIDEEERKALFERQKNDKQTLARNKRMFGMLVGTLQRFRTEETDREQLTIKRSKIEEKLEIANEEEIASSMKETERLIKLRHQKEFLLEKTQLKLDTISMFKNWEKNHIHLRCYIRTETKPKIFWLPREHISVTEKKLKDTKDYFSLCVAEQTAKFKKDMENLDVELEKLNEAIKPYENKDLFSK